MPCFSFKDTPRDGKNDSNPHFYVVVYNGPYFWFVSCLSSMIPNFSICVLWWSCVLLFSLNFIIDHRSPVPILKNTVPILKNTITENSWKYPDVFFTWYQWCIKCVLNPFEVPEVIHKETCPSFAFLELRNCQK